MLIFQEQQDCQKKRQDKLGLLGNSKINGKISNEQNHCLVYQEGKNVEQKMKQEVQNVRQCIKNFQTILVCILERTFQDQHRRQRYQKTGKGNLKPKSGVSFIWSSRVQRQIFKNNLLLNIPLMESTIEKSRRRYARSICKTISEALQNPKLWKNLNKIIRTWLALKLREQSSFQVTLGYFALQKLLEAKSQCCNFIVD